MRCFAVRPRGAGSSGRPAFPKWNPQIPAGSASRPERVAVRDVFLSGSVGDDLVAVDGQGEQRAGERLGPGAGLQAGFRA